MPDNQQPSKPTGKMLAKRENTALVVRNGIGQLSKMFQSVNNKSGRLPNAALIYGFGASILFVVAVFSLFSGYWFRGLLLLVLGGLLTTMAAHIIKHH